MTQSPFTIQGPDDEGNVWVNLNDPEISEPLWVFHIGKSDQVAEIFRQWLASIEERL